MYLTRRVHLSLEKVEYKGKDMDQSYTISIEKLCFFLRKFRLNANDNKCLKKW